MTYSRGQEQFAAWIWIAVMAIVGVTAVSHTGRAVRDIFRLGLSTATVSILLLMAGIALVSLSNATATLLFTLFPSRSEKNTSLVSSGSGHWRCDDYTGGRGDVLNNATRENGKQCLSLPQNNRTRVAGRSSLSSEIMALARSCAIAHRQHGLWTPGSLGSEHSPPNAPTPHERPGQSVHWADENPTPQPD